MMSTPQYRQRLQQLASAILPMLPAHWMDASVLARFPRSGTTELELAATVRAGRPRMPLRMPADQASQVAIAARGIRAELTAAGNPACRSFEFTLTSSGSSALSVDY